MLAKDKIKETNMERREWLLLFLALPIDTSPSLAMLDPIRIMKGMFLFSMQTKEVVESSYSFEPFHYGPCSLEIYRDLEYLEEAGFIHQIRVPMQTWGIYETTLLGQEHAEQLSVKVNRDLIAMLLDIKKRVLSLSFLELLRQVYSEYPEYAQNSILSFR